MSAQATILKNEFENYNFKISATSARDHGVNILFILQQFWLLISDDIFKWILYQEYTCNMHDLNCIEVFGSLIE